MEKNLIEFFIEANKIKAVERYAAWSKSLRDSVAEHSFMMIVIADKLITHFKLQYDYQRVIQYILMHDWGEIESKKDECAPFVTDRPKKKAAEKVCAHNSLSRFNCNDYIGAYDEFHEQADEESKFVNFVDKIESQLFFLSKGVKKYSLDGLIYNLHYADKATAEYPRLKEFANELQEYYKQQIRRVYGEESV